MAEVSIITALHNKGPYVAQAIRSVVAQTMADWELIVVDNGSSDDGPEQVRRLAGDDLRIRLMSSPKRGPGTARNCGLACASGDWVLFLDADDLLTSEYLAEQTARAQCRPSAQIIAGCWREFPEASPQQTELRQPTLYRDDPGAVCDSAIGFAPWALHAAIVRRDWLGDRIRWFEHLDGWPSEDTAFWFAALQGATLAWSESHGALYRINTHNSRNSPKDALRWLEGLKQVIATNLNTLTRSGKTPSTAQRATLMRTFESRYRQEINNRNQEVAALFLAEANRWLHSCSWNERAIALRKIVGIRLVSQFRRSSTDSFILHSHPS